MRMPELTALLTATAVFTSALAFAARADEVHVLNWKGYGTDEPWAVAAFEKATGNKVVNDFFNSEQEMLTKIRTNPGLYDVVMINAAFDVLDRGHESGGTGAIGSATTSMPSSRNSSTSWREACPRIGRSGASP